LASILISKRLYTKQRREGEKETQWKKGEINICSRVLARCKAIHA